MDGWKTVTGALILGGGIIAMYVGCPADIAGSVIAIGVSLGGVGVADKFKKLGAIIANIPWEAEIKEDAE